MEENKLLLRSKGYTPKKFIEISNENAEEVIEEIGLADILDTDIDVLYEEWTQVFKKVNDEIIENLPDSFDVSKIPTIDIEEEVYKVSEIIGYTVTFTYYNIYKIDWFNIITEYFLYMSDSIGSAAGLILYWLTIQCIFQETRLEHEKSKKLLHYIEKNYEFVTNNKYFTEVNTIAKIFPFNLLNVEKLDISDIVIVILWYPNGVLNRFTSEHFPKIPKKINKNLISKLIDIKVKSALGNFNIEELWKERNEETIRNFLKEGIIQKNNISNYSLLNSSNPCYINTIITWIENQINVLKDLNEVEKLEINTPQEQDVEKKIPAKYYALYYLIMVELKEEKGFSRDGNDKNIRKEIEAFAAKKYPNISPQGFYRAYLNNDILNKEAIVMDNKDFKEKISIIAKNNPRVLQYLKSFPG